MQPTIAGMPRSQEMTTVVPVGMWSYPDAVALICGTSCRGRPLCVRTIDVCVAELYETTTPSSQLPLPTRPSPAAPRFAAPRLGRSGSFTLRPYHDSRGVLVVFIGGMEYWPRASGKRFA